MMLSREEKRAITQRQMEATKRWRTMRAAVKRGYREAVARLCEMREEDAALELESVICDYVTHHVLLGIGA